MTKEDAKKIIDIMVEHEDFELIINKERDRKEYYYNKLYVFAWTIRIDSTNQWQHDFHDEYGNEYSDEEIMEILIECDKHMILDTTKTIFVWQSKSESTK